MDELDAGIADVRGQAVVDTECGEHERAASAADRGVEAKIEAIPVGEACLDESGVLERFSLV